MTITYDTNVDAAYIYLSKEKIEKSVPISEDMIVDMDSLGNPVGIEVLEASSHTEFINVLKKDMTLPAEVIYA